MKLNATSVESFGVDAAVKALQSARAERDLVPASHAAPAPRRLVPDQSFRERTLIHPAVRGEPPGVAPARNGGGFRAGATLEPSANHGFP